jgi:DNA mismatch repair protein MutS2
MVNVVKAGELHSINEHDEPEFTPLEDGPREKTLGLLDYPAVRRRVADHATFAPARELALRMTPSYRAHDVEELQRETAEGRTLLDIVGELNLHAGADASDAVTRAALEGVLTGMELLEVAASLEVQRRARTSVLRAAGDGEPRKVKKADRPTGQKIPVLAELAEGIPDLEELQRQIRDRIGSRGEVLDDAASTLRSLRSQLRRAYDTVTEALTRIIQSAAGRESLQDQVISVRGDRLVLQIKTEMRNRVPGIVHDASNTGATLFIEPFTTVDLCNSWRELALEEEREVMRVLRDISTLVGALADDIRRGAELTARLDFVLARARYSMAIRGVPVISRSARRPDQETPVSSNMAVRLLNARHPLLSDGAVPINVNIGPGWSILVITGPNTGGKTVAMKTVGLLALMYQSGLHVPADEGSSLPVFDGVYADVGDQQSIERSVSTFSSHMRSVIEILAAAGPASLVLLDELGTSTDPEEGSALAKAVLDHLATRTISTVVTTHYRAVAAYAETTDGLMNASVQLEASTLAPDYHLTMGIPGRSYAMSVASRLGLPEEIMEKARSLLEPRHMLFEDWLNELQDQRRQLLTRLEEAEQGRAQAEAVRKDLEAQLDYLAGHREEILGGIRREMLSKYEEVRRKLRRAEAALSWSVSPTRGPSEDVAQVKADVSDVKRELESQRLRPTAAPRKAERHVIAVGDVVDVRGLNLQGTVVSLPEKGQEADVSVGSVRLRIDLGRLTPAEGQPVDSAGSGPPLGTINLGPSLTSMELDLRGLRADEALFRLEEFLDKAVRDGLSSVRIIHGRGTGALRQVVREHLPRHPLARSFAPESRERGGDGATLVELA